MTHAKFESTHTTLSVYSYPDRKNWHRQFIHNLRAVLYCQNSMIHALNLRGSIAVHGRPHHNFSCDEVSNALNHLAGQAHSDYSAFSWDEIYSTLGLTGLLHDEITALPAAPAICYDAAIHYALAPLCTEHPETGKPAIIKPSHSKHRLLDSTIEPAFQAVKNAMISDARHEIRNHLQYHRSYQRLEEVCYNSGDERTTLILAGSAILSEVSAVIEANQDDLDILKLIQVLDRCRTAIEDPSIPNALLCMRLSLQMDHRSFTKALKHAVISFAGLILLAMSLSLALASFGLATPISGMATAIGTPLLLSGILGGGALSTACLATGGVGFFHDVQKPKISAHLAQMASAIDTKNTVYPSPSIQSW